MDVPWAELKPEHRAIVLEGDGSWDKGKFPGVLGWFRWLETKTYKLHVRVLLARYRAYDPCRVCGGKRLNAAALSYRVGGKSLADWHALEIGEARKLTQRASHDAPGRARSRGASSKAAFRTSSASASATSRSIARRARFPAAKRSA